MVVTQLFLQSSTFISHRCCLEHDVKQHTHGREPPATPQREATLGGWRLGLLTSCSCSLFHLPARLYDTSYVASWTDVPDVRAHGSVEPERTGRASLVSGLAVIKACI